MTLSERALRRAALALIGAFFVVWTVICVRYGVNFPFHDQWDRPLRQIVHMFQGELRFFPDFWAQHNESRKVLPTAISLALAAVLGRYDTHVELGIGLAFFAALAFAIERLARAARMPAFVAATLALLFVALAGSSRTMFFHLFSITFERLIPELTLILALGLLLRRGLSWGTATLVALLLTAGQYSYASGMAGWLLVPAFALVAFRRELRVAGPPLAFLVGWGAVSTGAYFWGYARPPHHTPLPAILSQPVSSWIRFFLRFLGNPIYGYSRVAASTALLTLVVFAVAAVRAVRRPATARAALAWATLGAYSMSQALVATVARLPMSLDHAMRGDYIVHSTYFFVATAALLFLLKPPHRLVLVQLVVVTVALVSLLVPSTRQGLRETRAARLAARRCLFEAVAACRTPTVWTPADRVRERAYRAHEEGLL